MRKLTVDDVDGILELCSALNSLQLTKLLTLYTPEDGEPRIPLSVIRAVGRRGREEPSQGDTAPQLMLPLAIAPIVIPYEPANASLSSIEVPDALRTDMLVRM